MAMRNSHMTTGHSILRCADANRMLAKLAIVLCIGGLLIADRAACADEPNVQPVEMENAPMPVDAGELQVLDVQEGAQLVFQGNAVIAIAGQAPNNLLDQFTEQWRPTLNVELNFVRLVCGEIPMEQRKQIKAAGDQALSDVAKALVEQQQQAQQQMQQQPNLLVQWLGMKLQPRPIVPTTRIRETIAKAVKENVEGAIADRYAVEQAARLGRQKRAAILVVMARLDQFLYLTADQRREISESISAAWRPEWESWLYGSSYQSHFVPQFADQHVACLNDEQKSVWESLQKVDFGFNNLGQQAQLDVEWWGGPKPMGSTFWNMLRKAFE
jgi:hypothetical protein